MTVPTDFAGAVALLGSARGPADVFDNTDPVHAFREFVKLVHPDRVRDGDKAAATEAFGRLTALWAMRTPQPVTLTSSRHSYRVGPVVARGDLAALYETTVDTAPALLKIGVDPGCNDLLVGEAAVLRRIADHGEARFRPYVPTLMESFSYREPDTGVERAVNVLGRATGFVRLADVAVAYPAGLDPRDAAWMWRRLLVAIGHAHRAGVIHGAVLPEHVLIHPGDHGLMLIDWCYATTGGAPIPAIVPRHEASYPREVTAGDRPGPGTDVHLATVCMVNLIGDRMPAALRLFARGCTLPALAARPDDAWSVLAELDDVLRRLYGERTFRPFPMPAPGSGAQTP